MNFNKSTSIRSTFFVTVIALLLTGLPLEANTPLIDTTSELPNLKRAKWVGIWDYSVKDVPPEYSKGVLHVSKLKRQHLVQIELASGTLDAENVVVKKQELSFTLDLEGQQIEVSLTMDGDTFKGESSSADGVFLLEGSRRN